MKLIYKNDFDEELKYELKNGMLQFYFIDMNGIKKKTKLISIDYLMGGTF